MDSKGRQKELARAHIKIQQLHRIWEPDIALRKGTIFPELYRPYCPVKEHNDRWDGPVASYEDQAIADYYQYYHYRRHQQNGRRRGGKGYGKR